MLNYIEILKAPAQLVTIFAAIFLVIQIIGEILTFKGKVVPEFMRIKEYVKRKKKEKVALSQITELLDEHKEMAETISDVQRLLIDVDKHYNNDNIIMRNKWMNEVNEHISTSERINKEQDSMIHILTEKLSENTDITLSLLIDNKRDTIIDFASKVIDENSLVTREQFNRIFKIHKEYEEIIEKKGFTNGEVNIAIRIIQESYEKHLKSHSFVEDIRGYNN